MGCALIAVLVGGLGALAIYTSAVLGFFMLCITAMVTPLAGLIGLVLLI